MLSRSPLGWAHAEMALLWGCHLELSLCSGHLLRQGVESCGESWLDHKEQLYGMWSLQDGPKCILTSHAPSATLYTWYVGVLLCHWSASYVVHTGPLHLNSVHWEGGLEALHGRKGIVATAFFQGLSLDCKSHKIGTVPFISVSRMHSVWHTVSDVSIINTVVLLVCVQIITFLVLFFESPSCR